MDPVNKILGKKVSMPRFVVVTKRNWKRLFAPYNLTSANYLNDALGNLAQVEHGGMPYEQAMMTNKKVCYTYGNPKTDFRMLLQTMPEYLKEINW